MKRILFGVFSVFLAMFFCISAYAAGGEVQSWYCVRNKAHKQPIFPAELSFVEDHNGVFLDRKHGDGATEKVVYLTFDAGYENGNVARILDTLQETQTPGAFFLLKHFITANPELVLRMKAEGHTVCNHTATHRDLSTASAETVRGELLALEESYSALTGEKPAAFFRPPEGRFSRQMLETVSDMGYTTVFWSFAYADWDNNKQMPVQKALQCVMDNVHNGAVMLFHPTSATNAEILPTVIAELKAQGYRFGTLEELCGGS